MGKSKKKGGNIFNIANQVDESVKKSLGTHSENNTTDDTQPKNIIYDINSNTNDKKILPFTGSDDNPYKNEQDDLLNSMNNNYSSNTPMDSTMDTTNSNDKNILPVTGSYDNPYKNDSNTNGTNFTGGKSRKLRKKHKKSKHKKLTHKKYKHKKSKKYYN